MAEQQRLEELNNVLEMRLERNNLQVKSPVTGGNDLFFPSVQSDSVSSDLNSAAVFSTLEGAADSKVGCPWLVYFETFSAYELLWTIKQNKTVRRLFRCARSRRCLGGTPLERDMKNSHRNKNKSHFLSVPSRVPHNPSFPFLLREFEVVIY